jgi:hypothetical protein
LTDITSAIGPYATIYGIWKNTTLEGSKTEVPYWIL